MYELLVVIESADFVKFFLDEVFHGLHVVVGDFLDILNATSVLFIEVAVNVSQSVEEPMIHICQLWKRQLAKGNEIFNFHSQTIADERIL